MVVTEPSTISPMPGWRAGATPVSESSLPVTLPWDASSNILRPLPPSASRICRRAGVRKPAMTASSTRRHPRYHLSVHGPVSQKLVVGIHLETSSTTGRSQRRLLRGVPRSADGGLAQVRTSNSVPRPQAERREAPERSGGTGVDSLCERNIVEPDHPRLVGYLHLIA